MESVKIGKYKVAYWSPTNSEVLHAMMYDDLQHAQMDAEALHHQGFLYTIMESQTIRDGTYSWKILPEGVRKHFPLMTQLYKYKDWLSLASLAYFLSKVK